MKKILLTSLLLFAFYGIKAQVRIKDTLDCREVIKFQTEKGFFVHRLVDKIIKQYDASEAGIYNIQYYIEGEKVDIIYWRNKYYLSTAKFEF